MALSFQELAAQYLDGPLRKKTTHANYVRIHAQFFREWAEHPTRAQIKAWHVALEHHAAHSNKALGFLKALYNWAMDQGYWTAANPAAGIKRHPTYSRERVMDRREIMTLLHGLSFLNEKYRAWFLCRLLVPCRIKELCAMHRPAVDPYGKWTKHQTKNNRIHVIYVARQAMNALQALPVEGDYFFMGHYGRPLTACAARKIWSRLRADLGLSDLWLLDYRRTLATYLYRVQKVDDLTAKAILGHYDGRPVAIYTRLDYDYLADIIQGYADWLLALSPQPAIQQPAPHEPCAVA